MSSRLRSRTATALAVIAVSLISTSTTTAVAAPASPPAAAKHTVPARPTTHPNTQVRTPAIRPSSRPAGRVTHPVLSRRGAIPGDYSVIGHRGVYRDPHVTENTIPAWTKAWREGATAVEADVRPTRDGKLVIFHDHALSGVTTAGQKRHIVTGKGCTGDVVDRTLVYIRSHCRGAYDHAKVATLDDYLRWAENHGMNVLVELKINMTSESTNACNPSRHPLCAGTTDGWTKTRVAEVIDDIDRHQMASRATLISYGKTVLTWAERIAPSVHTQYIGFTYAGARHYPAGVDQVALKASWIKHHPSSVAWFAGRGVSVQGQESNTAAQFKTFYAHGVRQILTDRVSTLRSVMRRSLHSAPGAARSATPTA